MTGDDRAPPLLEDKAPAALRVVPQQKRAAATVQRVLRAAMSVLRAATAPERDGIAMETIAGKAGVSVPAVYRYFSSVDAIYSALVQQEQARILQQGLVILAARKPATDLEMAGTLVDFFIRVFSELLHLLPGPVRFLLRHHHEVGYDTFAAACPEVRAAMEAGGMLDGRDLHDLQIVAALSSLASTVKALILTEPAQLMDPGFRDRTVRMVMGALGTSVGELTRTAPVEWRYDGPHR